MGMQFESSNDPISAIKHYNLGVDGGDSASNYVGLIFQSCSPKPSVPINY